MDVFEWVEHSLNPTPCTSVEFMYDDMDSQSDYSLPVIYQPFDVDSRWHWRDRGALFDYVSSVGTGLLLDYGPGDGWPSLIVAPYVRQVIGVDASHRRVAVCTENASRLGLANVEFRHVKPGRHLPFPDGYFDGIMAASSVEQTPDPKETLREFFRVLRPGGRFRVVYEALARYRGEQEREAWLWEAGHRTSLVLVDRDIDGERARQYRLVLDLSREQTERALVTNGGPLSLEHLTMSSLQGLRPHVVEAMCCSLIHPSGETMASWLREVGFGEVVPSHSGAWFAGQLFDELQPYSRPKDMKGVDAMLRHAVAAVVQMAAPLEADPMITAVK